MAAKSAIGETARYLQTQYHTHVQDNGDVIWEADWDICLVVDACRYDAWTDIAPEYDWLHSASGWSVGSASPEWYGETFRPDVLPEDESIGVVTANPFSGKPGGRVSPAPDESLPLSRHNLAVLDEVWRDQWGTTTPYGYVDVTHPAVVTDRAYEVWSAEELDRLVVHYMQPHIPFRSRPEWFGKRGDLDRFGEADYDADNPGKDPWLKVRDGELPRDEFWQAYLDNLRWVLDDIDRLRQSVDAKLLLTSDHGNGMGEWGTWSHPPKCYVSALRRVPWVTVTAEATREFEPRDIETGSSKSTVEKLEALGYR